ncbi:CAO1B [Auxenochlorella protothecoides x Auxenochlorella symbiontica]|uniref:Rieske domain-containing protein n=1 Tax=Auxenochlorella protothecoides TaxID=3075 RepID=A0A1D2A1I1_AUXPR
MLQSPRIQTTRSHTEHGVLSLVRPDATRRRSASPSPCRALPLLPRRPAPAQTAADSSSLHTPLDILKHDLEYMEGALGALVTVHEDLVAALNPLAAQRMLMDLHAEMKVLEVQLQAAQLQLAANEAALQESVSVLDSMLDRVSRPGLGARLGHDGSGAGDRPVGATPPAAQSQARGPGIFARPRERLASGSDEAAPTWRAVASASVLRKKGAMATAEVLGQVYLLFRDASGAVACIKDQCAHRACPLSSGKIVDGCAQCPYHGWQYDGAGGCVSMPSTVFQQGISVDTLPVKEAEGKLWVWTTDPNAAASK